jgi:hypothetical protein
MSFFFYHWWFLSTDYKYIKDFFIGRVERNVASSIPLGEELYDVVSQYDDIVFVF